MVKIEANTDRSFLINGVPYQKGQYEISPLSNKTQIKIVRVGSNVELTQAPLTDWVDAGDSPFADFAAFVLYTEPFFFRSVAGGGGGGVTTVSGDGVNNTDPANPVLTFPSANEVPNDSLIPGATTALALNELGAAVSDNATDIGNNTSNLNLHVGNVNNPHSTQIASLDDVILSTPQESEILAFISGTWQNITSPAFNPVSSGVLTDYNSSQDATVSTTNSTTGITYINLNTTGAVIGNPYKFTCSFSISHDATNSNAFIDIKDFGVSVLTQVYTVEPKDTNDRTWVTLQGEILPNALGAGQFQLQLDFGTDDGDDDTTMYFGYLSLQKIN